MKMYERAAGDKTLPSDLRPPPVLKVRSRISYNTAVSLQPEGSALDSAPSITSFTDSSKTKAFRPRLTSFAIARVL